MLLKLYNPILWRSLTVSVSCNVVQSIFVEILDCKCNSRIVQSINQYINQGLFSIQTNNNNNIHTFVYMNTERAGNEVKLLI